MYTLAMWNSYLFVSALDIFVVVLAGLISIFSARRSQKAIEKVGFLTSSIFLQGLASDMQVVENMFFYCCAQVATVTVM